MRKLLIILFILLLSFFSADFVLATIFLPPRQISKADAGTELIRQKSKAETYSASEKNTEGIINSAYKYAWSNQIGWINFAPTDKDKSYIGLIIKDSAIMGYAWSQNLGWINFSPTNGGVTNNISGNLFGKAWGENTGWIDFNGVSISIGTGQFSGVATGDIAGSINFNCASCKVVTNWRPGKAPATGAITVNKTTVGGDGAFNFTITGSGYSNFSITTANGSGANTQTNLAPGTYSATETVPPGRGWTKTIDTCSLITVVAGQTTACSVTNIKEGTEVPPVVPEPSPGIPEPPPGIPPPPDTPKTPTGIIETIVDTITKIADSIEKFKEIKEIKEIKKIIETPVASIATKVISTIGAAGGAVATVSVIASSYSFSDIFLTIIRFFGVLLTAFGIKKRILYWGVVYDSITKQPLDPAYIILKDSQGKDIASAITDIDGRYGFLIQPGIYQITAKKTNYAFPSQKLIGKAQDEIYNNLYFGKQIEIKKMGEVITKNIPLDPIKFDWNEFAKKNKNFMKFYSRWDFILRKVSDLFFVVGFVIAITAFFFAPRPYNTIILAVYLLLLLLRTLGLKPKSFGYIINKITDVPLSFAVLRIITASSNVEISHRIADIYGRYYCLIPKGKYYVKIEKKNNDGSYSLAYTSDIIDASKKGIIRKKFEI